MSKLLPAAKFTVATVVGMIVIDQVIGRTIKYFSER